MKWTSTKQNNFNIYNVEFCLKKQRKIHVNIIIKIFIRSTVPEIQNILKLVILGHFWPLYPLKNPKNQNFDKWKNLLQISSFYKWVPKSQYMMYSSWDMEWDGHNFLSFWVILHKRTKNHDHMLYCSWDMVCDRCNCYFSVWTIFCPFTP